VKRNGKSSGNIIVVDYQPPRYDEHYMRFTPPTNDCPADVLSGLGLPLLEGPHLLFSPGGAIYLAPYPAIVVAGDKASCLACGLGPDVELRKLFFAFGFLKSAVSIWLTNRCATETELGDLFLHAMALRVPGEPSQGALETVSSIVDSMVALERAYLDGANALSSQAQDRAEVNRRHEELRVEHNRKATPLMHALDTFFYEYCQLSEVEVNLIRRALTACGYAAF
jgi:hypothetical protein